MSSSSAASSAPAARKRSRSSSDHSDTDSSESTEPSPSSSSSVQSVVDDLAVGQYFSLLRYGRITGFADGAVLVATDDGSEWRISKTIVAKSCFTAHQFSATQMLTATQLAERFERAGDHVWSVCFRKQPDPNVVADELLSADVQSMTQAQRRRLARQLLAGEQRTMIGRIVNHRLDVNGRVLVMDLEQNALRLVDPRTLEWFVYRNVRYELRRR